MLHSNIDMKQPINYIRQKFKAFGFQNSNKVYKFKISTLDILDQCMLHSNIDMKQPINYKSLGSSKFSWTNLQSTPCI